MARASTACVLVRKGQGASPIYFSVVHSEVQGRNEKDAVRFSRREDALIMKRAYGIDSHPEEVMLG